jgi:hypothetical protein
MLLVFGAFGSLMIGIAAAQNQQMNGVVLKKVKAATVYLQVKLLDGRVVQGSGFFTDEPGLIATNAHVLDMLDADSRKPLRIDVGVDDGTGTRRMLAGKVVGVDRTSDLGLIRVDDRTVPQPLKLGTTSGLSETESVFVFGFPFGKDLGQEITVGRSTISSLRKSVAGNIQRVQLDGGLNPGNSGGPVVDSEGNVIGIAVSVVRGAQIGFAIPAEYVVSFLNGRIGGSSVGTPYKDGGRLMLPVKLEMIDPLGRLKRVDVELWAGNPGPPRLASLSEPAPLPGDSAKQRYSMKYDKNPTVALDFPAPSLADAKQVYWIQPIIANGLNQTRWASALPAPARTPLERLPITLKYSPPIGGKQTAEMVSIGSFRIRNRDGEEFALATNFRTSLSAHFSEAEPRFFPMRLTYDRFSLSITLDDKPLPGTAELRKGLTAIRLLSANVEMDKDGSLSAAKPDLTQVPISSRAMLSDICDQVLESLEALSVPLPEKKVEALDTWKADRNLRIGSAIVAVPGRANIVYKYLGVQPLDGKTVALVSIEGHVKGRELEGLNASGSVVGQAFISTDTGEVVKANVTVKADVDIVLARKPAKAMGTLSVSIQRPAPVTGKQ